MSEADLKQIAEIMVERSYQAGAVIIAEKTEAERFFIVHKGKIEISKRFEGGDKAVLSIQSDGAFFGEMAILDEGRRSATVTALEPTSVFEILRSDFETLLYKAPVLAYRILKELSARLRETGALIVSLHASRNRHLYRTYIDTMSVFVDMLQDRGGMAPGRTERVTELALSIGARMGMGEEDMLLLELSAVLHDLGMLMIGPAVLDRTRKLSEEELGDVRAHTGRAAEMLGGVSMLKKILPGILHHHEWYDGSGYPEGLAGDRIPRVSAILAVADAYVAMTGDRSYKPRKEPEAAAEEIKDLSGVQFDPEVVKAFLKATRVRADALHAKRGASKRA